MLNVIPDEWRKTLLHQMADKLKIGGKLVINVRSAESIKNQGTEGKTRITLDDESEILVLRPNGSIKAYQKGFTKQELKSWCEEELGDGYDVEIANSDNAGGSYDTAVVITKHINFKAKYGLIGAGITVVVEDEEALQMLKGRIDSDIYSRVVLRYNDKTTTDTSFPQFNISFVFNKKAFNHTLTWWHENTHVAYRNLSLEDKQECAFAVLDWLKNNSYKSGIYYDNITENYPKEEWDDEAVAFMIEHIIDVVGVEAFLNANFEGNKKISKLVNAIRNQLIYGKEKPTNSDKLRRIERGFGATTIDSETNLDETEGDGKDWERQGVSQSKKTEQGRVAKDARRDSEGFQGLLAERQGSGVTMASDPVSKAIGELRYGLINKRKRMFLKKFRNILLL